MLPMQPGDVQATAADISAIQRDVGFAPTTDIAVGVPRFVSWFRDYQGI
jgi:UDP-glucuronate 4-epimerase